MTEKLSEYEITGRDWPFINAECNARIINTLVRKINELVDVVNEMRNNATISKTEKVDPCAEQYRWIGKLCKFWDNSDEPENCVYDVLCNIFDSHHEDCPFQCGNGEWYEYCEPVKPDDDIIYKGGNNE